MRKLLILVIILLLSTPIQAYADTATAYWNGSCGKKITSRGYGVTADGTHHRNKSWKVRTVAADPNVYPIGTKLKITFPKHLSKYNGVFTVRDTGGRIKGHIIDIYLDNAQMCKEFGRQKVKVKIIDSSSRSRQHGKDLLD